VGSGVLLVFPQNPLVEIIETNNTLLVETEKLGYEAGAFVTLCFYICLQPMLALFINFRRKMSSLCVSVSGILQFVLKVKNLFNM